MDVIFLQFPNKTMEIPPLGTSILVGALKDRGYSVKQYDLNVEIKDALLKKENLKYIFDRILPFLLKMDMTDKSYESMLVLYKLLDFLNSEYSFDKVEKVKIMLQNRQYVEVFGDKEKTILFENMLKILSLSSSFFETVVSNDIVEQYFPDFFFFDMISQILEKVINYKPMAIGFSVVQMQRKISVWVCERLRVKFNYKNVIFFGGSDVTYYKEKYLENFEYIDYAIYQEGELALPLFLDYIAGKTEIENVPNLIYRDNGKVEINDPITPCDFDVIVLDFSDLHLQLYLTHALPMQISRGCSWGKCTYCKHFRTYGEKYYAGSIENNIRVIKILMEKYKTNLFHFVDDDFPRVLKNKFCTSVIKNNLNIRWLTYSRLDDKITYDDMNLWYKAGLRVVEWGLESASQKVLDSVNKGINIDNIKRLLFDANKIGLLNKLFMFHNLPEEDYEDLYTSIQFLKKFVRYGIVRVFWEISTPLELLEGTILYEQAEKNDIFVRVFKPRGLLEAKAGYVHRCNYQIKQDIFNKELEDEEEYYKKKGILNVNDEAIMFDVIIEELSQFNTLYAKVR